MPCLKGSKSGLFDWMDTDMGGQIGQETINTDANPFKSLSASRGSRKIGIVRLQLIESGVRQMHTIHGSRWN